MTIKFQVCSVGCLLVMDYMQSVCVSASQISLIGNSVQMKQTTEIREKNQMQQMKNQVRKSNEAEL